MEALRESHVEMWSSWGKDVKFIYVWTSLCGEKQIEVSKYFLLVWS